MSDKNGSEYFRFFTEIGILEQLSRAMLQARLPDGMLVPHFTVLNHLVRVKDGRTPLELAQAFQVPKTTMTHTLAGLVKAGLVVMRANEDDGRSKRVWISKKGIAFRDKAIRSLDEDVERLSTSFSVARVKRLLPELEAIRKTMDADRDRR
ncbi:MAG: MarR family transcriptional regulator [Pseudomonadota bacterium]